MVNKNLNIHRIHRRLCAEIVVLLVVTVNLSSLSLKTKKIENNRHLTNDQEIISNNGIEHKPLEKVRYLVDVEERGRENQLLQSRLVAYFNTALLGQFL